MNIKYRIICDECGSDNVLHELKRMPEPEPLIMSMTSFIERQKVPQTTYAVYYYTHYILLCKDCGHKKEYSV